jgi:putative peptidoglycan lipid II flippase
MSRKGLLRSTAIFTSMTFLSRIAGFARDWLQASLFGTNAAVSAFVVAYRIPNYLRRIFAEGSFSSAFVPVLSELKESGDEKALQDFLDHIAGALLAVVMLVTAIGMLSAPWIARLFLLFAGENSETVALTADMLRITFPYLMFISMTALAGSVLNSYKHFGLPAFTPVLHNLSLIAAMYFLARYFDIREFSLAWGVFIAGVAQVLLLWPAMARHAKSPHFKFNFKHEGVRRVFKLMLPTIFSSSVSQLICWSAPCSLRCWWWKHSRGCITPIAWWNCPWACLASRLARSSCRTCRRSMRKKTLQAFPMLSIGV